MSQAKIGMALVLACALIEGFAQVCLKKSVLLTAQQVKYAWVGLGLALFGVEALLYSTALQWLAIGTAYSLGASSILAVSGFSKWLLKETLDTRRLAGLSLIVFGCAMVASQG